MLKLMRYFERKGIEYKTVLMIKKDNRVLDINNPEKFMNALN